MGETVTDEAKKPLTRKQQVFVNEYLICFNGAEAARRAGYSEKSARTIAADLLAETNISEQIQARLSEVHMSADEAIKRLSDMARGDIGQFMDRLGSLDIQAARDAGLTPLIKKIKQRTITKIGKKDDDDDTEIHDLEIELYSAKDAIDTILKVGGKLKDTELTINVRLTDD
jgi:phage terminase small subunit